MKKSIQKNIWLKWLKISFSFVFAFLIVVFAGFSVLALDKKMDIEGASNAYAEALRMGKNEVDLGKFNVPEEKLKIMLLCAQNSNADIFWYPLSIEYSTYKDDGCIATISWENVYDDFSDVEEKRKEFEKYAGEAINVCFDYGMTDLEKIISAHDYLTEMCVYSLDDDYSYTAYSIFARNTGVCQGYAYAFKYLMDAAGVECYIASSNEIDHAWNIVSLDGEYYNVDVTQDDGKALYNNVEVKHGRSNHKTLLCSDEALDNGAKDVVVWSIEEIPARVSKKYDDAFFKDVRGSVEFIDGFFYYVEPNEHINGSFKVLKTSSDFSKTEVFFEALNPVYAIAKHGKNLYCAVKDKVFVLDQGGTATEVCSTVGEIFGLCVKENNLLYGVYRKKSYAVCNKIIEKNLDCVEGMNLEVKMNSVILNVYVKDFIELSDESLGYSIGVSETSLVKFKSIENGILSIPVNFSEIEDDISDKINIEIKVDGRVKTYSSSLSDYLLKIIEGKYDEKTKNLAKALILYGDFETFGDFDMKIPEGSKTVILDSSDEISYKGIEVEVGKKVSVKVKFSVIGNAEFKANGRFETEKEGLYHTVVIPDVSFVNFQDEFKISSKNISFNFSILGLSESCDEETRARIEAIYLLGNALSSFK